MDRMQEDSLMRCDRMEHMQNACYSSHGRPSPGRRGSSPSFVLSLGTEASLSVATALLCELSVSLRSFTYCSYAENPQTLVHRWDGASREKKGGEKLGWGCPGN